MSEARTLINFQRLPEAKQFLNREEVEANIKEAGALAERKLLDRAQHFFVTGWFIDESWGRGGFDFNLVQHTIVGKLRLVRP